MDPDGARRLNRSSPSCLNSGAQRTDFFHGLLWDAGAVGLDPPPAAVLGVERVGQAHGAELRGEIRADIRAR